MSEYVSTMPVGLRATSSTSLSTHSGLWQVKLRGKK